MQDDEFGLEELRAIRMQLGEDLSRLDEVITNLESVLPPFPHPDRNGLIVAMRHLDLRVLKDTRKAINDHTNQFSGAVTITILAVKRKYPRQYNP